MNTPRLALLRHIIQTADPSPRTLCAVFGWSEIITAKRHLRALVRLGLISERTHMPTRAGLAAAANRLGEVVA